MTMIRMKLVIGFFVAGCVAVRSQEPSALTDREIAALVEFLVSPNAAPKTKESTAVWPPGFDVGEQRKVHGAYERLLNAGMPAIPHLLQREKDDRYCLTVRYDSEKNMSVASVCREIVVSQLQPFGPFTVESKYQGKREWRPWYPEAFLADGKAAAWWEKNKHKSLYQVQLEVVEWVILEESKQPTKYSEQEKKHLQEIRKELVEGGQPLKSGRIPLALPNKR